MAKSRFAIENRAVSNTQTMPAPVGGLNARDSLAQMKPDQAVQMVNWYPLQYGVRVRRGSREHTSGLPGEVETLFTHVSLDGTERLFAAVGADIYDVTVPGVAATPVVTGKGSARWQWTNTTNEFGSFTLICNGVDTPMVFNGTAWTDLVITAPVEYPDFDPKRFINVSISHRRVWWVMKDTGDAWYLPTDLIQGEAARFGVGEVFPRGGFLQAMGTWSTESGGGMKDNTVFVSSEGDVAIFAGYDPETAEQFNLAGVYRLGATFSRRCLQKYGSDMLVLCEDGVYPLSEVLSQSKVLMAGAISDIIQLRLSQDVTLYAREFGWEMLMVNRHQLLFLNVPATGTEGHRQYVMNQVTRAWCQFTGYDASCWGLLDDEPYYGTGTGFIYRAWYGDTDEATDTFAGNSIPALCQQAFSYFGGQSFQKRWTMMRPVFNADQYPSIRSTVSTDFNLTVATASAPPTTIAAIAAKWDMSYWDEGRWGGGLSPFSFWYSVNRVGYCAAPFVQTQTVGETYWITTDFVFEQGGML